MSAPESTVMSQKARRAQKTLKQVSVEEETPRRLAGSRKGFSPTHIPHICTSEESGTLLSPRHLPVCHCCRFSSHKARNFHSCLKGAQSACSSCTRAPQSSAQLLELPRGQFQDRETALVSAKAFFIPLEKPNHPNFLHDHLKAGEGLSLLFSGRSSIRSGNGDANGPLCLPTPIQHGIRVRPIKFSSLHLHPRVPPRKREGAPTVDISGDKDGTTSQRGSRQI